MKGVALGGGSEWFMKLKLGFSDGLDPVRDIYNLNSILIIWQHKMATGVKIFTIDFELFSGGCGPWGWVRVGYEVETRLC